MLLAPTIGGGQTPFLIIILFKHSKETRTHPIATNQLFDPQLQGPGSTAWVSSSRVTCTDTVAPKSSRVFALYSSDIYSLLCSQRL